MPLPTPPFLLFVMFLVTGDHRDSSSAQNCSGVEGCSELACWWRHCFNDLDVSSPSASPPREPPPLGMHVPPWQSVHQANSLAPFLHLTRGSRNPAMSSNGPLSLEAWQTLTLWGSPKPRRAGQGLRGTKAIFKSKGQQAHSWTFFKTCIYLVNNVC